MLTCVVRSLQDIDVAGEMIYVYSTFNVKINGVK
jgi:hypothetical protein